MGGARRGAWAIGMGLALLALAGLAPLAPYVLPPAAVVEPAWRDVGPSPRADEGYLPQGLAPFGERLLASAYRPGGGSVLVEVDPGTGAALRQWRMPPEASHTSGLAWDGARAWALDFDADRLYRLALPPEGGEVAVEASWPTGLRGASALALLDLDGEPVLALSEFGYRTRTYLLPVADVDQLRERGLAEAARASYRNGGFSQGLAADGARLVESVNHAGRDVLRVLEVADAHSSGDGSRVRALATLRAPGGLVEGVALVEGRLYALDEGSLRLSVADAPPLPRRV